MILKDSKSQVDMNAETKHFLMLNIFCKCVQNIVKLKESAHL